MDVRITDGGQNQTPIHAANVRRTDGETDALDVVVVGPSGEHFVQKSSNAVYNRVNIGTTATEILASNPNRIGLLVQNLETQQVMFGFDNAVTAGIYAGILSPTSASSGDGGALEVTDYTGSIYGIVASGDVDVSYADFRK